VHWLWWLPLALILFFLWLWLPSAKMQHADDELKDAGSLFGGYQSKTESGEAGDSAISIAARTIPVFAKDLRVTLESPAESTEDYSYVLNIQTIGVVAGTFDSDKFISFMENNREYIGQKLAEKLVSAKYDRLIKHDGDQYLKRVILDSIGEITDTNNPGEDTLFDIEPLEHYGAVDILLPDSFAVEKFKP
jgi:hypothetical protein